MPIIRNPRHERFALALAEGKSQDEAYALAGYKPSRHNASRLTTNDNIRARLAELQAGAAEKTGVTIESIAAQLDEDRELARTKGNAAACVSATMAKARLYGLLRENAAPSNAEPPIFPRIERIIIDPKNPHHSDWGTAVPPPAIEASK